MPISLPQKHIASPLDSNIVGFADTEIINGGTTSYVKYKEIKIPIKGKYRVKFDIAANVTFTYQVNGWVYKNGASWGTERSTVSTTYVTFTEDLDFDVGDLVQLYIKVATAGYAYWRNFRIYADIGETKVNMDS